MDIAKIRRKILDSLARPGGAPSPAAAPISQPPVPAPEPVEEKERGRGEKFFAPAPPPTPVEEEEPVVETAFHEPVASAPPPVVERVVEASPTSAAVAGADPVAEEEIGNGYEEGNDEGEDEESGPTGDELDILAFRLGEEDYAVRMLEMQEVLMDQEITFVPRTPPYLLGIISLRGKVIPVIDLKRRLAIGGDEYPEGRILVLATPKGSVGARVDRILGVFRIDPERIMPVLTTLSEDEARYIDGVARVGGRFVSVLALDEIVRIDIEE